MAVARRAPAPAGCRSSSPVTLAQLAQKAPSSELIGVGVAIIVLLLAFGSVVAMGLPIVTALMGIFVGAAGVGVLSAFMDVPEFSLILCTMIGLGVGIDYALFIVTRHRQHLHEGMSVEDAAGTANATAGQAVLFAGTTVVIAILGLFLAGLPAISAMGVVGGAGRDRRRWPPRSRCSPACSAWRARRSTSCRSTASRTSTKPADETLSGRWAHHVGSHPVRYAIVSLGALCAIAVPALSMRIGVPDDGNAAKHTTQRTAYDQLADGFGPGFNGPIQVVVEVPAPADRAAVDRVHDALQADPGIAAVTAPVFNPAGDTAVLTANPTTAPQDERTDAARPSPPLRRAAGHGRRAPTRGCRSPARRWSTDLTDRITEPAPDLHRRRSWRCRSCC